jgi:hypothetical protein
LSARAIEADETGSARQDAPTTPAPWLRWVGHSGYVVEGVVYVLIGAFALMAALEPSQQPNGYKGALAKLAAAPFGDAMLALLARNKTERVDLTHARLRGVIIALGTFGFLARGATTPQTRPASRERSVH